MVLEYGRAVIQILLIAVFLYYFFMSVYRNMASDFIRTLTMYFFVYLLSILLKMSVISYLMKICMLPMIVFMCILYQPELRRSFVSNIRKRGLYRISRSKTSSTDIDSVISACRSLSQIKRGALIVFPRKVSIKNIADTGTKINSDIASSLIVSIFDHDTPLHDGAMIIQNSKILSCGCYLPLSAQVDIRQSFGSRHRAALGLAEESDAVVVVVSEETGAISLAFNGSLYYQLDEATVKRVLTALLNDVEIDMENTEVRNGK